MTKLKQLRIEAGLTQKELANLSHIKLKRISEYETGERDLGNDTFSVGARIASALGVSVVELLDEQSD
jgi:transcriptional regulator with XRE-family HTH domain